MNFSRNRRFWLLAGIGLVILFTLISRGVSHYSTPFQLDSGMGDVIYADKYVNSGKWVFDCKYGRVVSREPLQPPVAALAEAEKPIQIISAYSLSQGDQAVAEKLINDLRPEDFANLKYLYSGLDDASEIGRHKYYLIREHEGRAWALEVTQTYWGKASSFHAAATPYNAAEYVDHEKALSTAAVSCPLPQ